MMKRRDFISQGTAALSLTLFSSPWQIIARAGESTTASRRIVNGIIEYRTAKQRICLVNSRNVLASVTSEGKVKLDFPMHKLSFDGSAKCKAWIFNAFMVPLSSHEAEMLGGDGLALPEGNYTFHLYWINESGPSSVADLRRDWWEVMQNPETSRRHTAPMEYVVVEVRDLHSGAVKELKPPADIQGVSWYPQYQETRHSLNLPPNKVFGITKRVEGIPAQELIDKGMYLQAMYEDVNGGLIPYNRTWSCHRVDSKGKAEVAFEGVIEPGQSVVLEKHGLNCNPGDIISLHKGYTGQSASAVTIEYEIPAPGTFRFKVKNNSSDSVRLGGGQFYANYFHSLEQEAQNLYNGYARRGHVTTTQICESGIPYPETEKIFQRVYQLQTEHEGVRNANDTHLVADYFTALYGYGTETNFFVQTAGEKRQLMSSQANARKQRMQDEPSRYYAERVYEYRHRFIGGYLDGIARLLDGERIYRHIANLERQYIAMPDRKVTTFGWVRYEGAQCQAERAGMEQRLPLAGGDFIRVSPGQASFEQMKFEAFFSLLIGDDYLIWDDNLPYSTSIEKFGLAHAGGAADWKNHWQPHGGPIVQYNAADPTHPQVFRGRIQWGDTACPGHNGAFCGAWLLSQIKNRINHSLAYAPFSYTVSGTQYSGYFNGNEPVKGEDGTAEISRFGRGNNGQWNVVDQEEHRKPIVLIGSGPEGKVAIILYPFAGLTEKVSYHIVHGNTHQIQHTGPSLGVYIL